MKNPFPVQPPKHTYALPGDELCVRCAKYRSEHVPGGGACFRFIAYRPDYQTHDHALHCRRPRAHGGR